MWLREKQALAMRKAQAKPTAKRSNIKSSGAFGKAETTFFVCPPVWAKATGKVGLVKVAQS
jgi:hypothetical protein